MDKQFGRDPKLFPVPIERLPIVEMAMQYTGDNAEAIIKWAGKDVIEECYKGLRTIDINNCDHEDYFDPGDWVVYYRCTYRCVPDAIFELEYKILPHVVIDDKKGS
jgi:hypothetical protein